MAEPFAHLHEDALKALQGGDVARIDYFGRDLWVGYSMATTVLRQIDKLILSPKIERMKNLLIVGDTNNGKSFVMKRFVSLHPPRDTEFGLKVPALLVQAPPTPDELRFYNNILRSLGIPFNPNDTLAKREKQILELLPALGIELLMVDEIHNLLAGSAVKQRQFLNVLKFLANQLKCSMVFAGTREASRALAVDGQMANRFPPSVLSLWADDDEWRRLLASFERLLPMPEPSSLWSKTLAPLLHSLSEGAIGELKELLLLALETAIPQRKSKIDKDLIESLNFVPPSKRRARAEKA